MKNFTIFILLFLILCPAMLIAQDIIFSYDASGNRIKREIAISRRINKLPATNTSPLCDNLNNKNIRIYPNPTKGMVKIEIIGYEDSDNGNVSIFNLSGQQILRSNFINGTLEFDLSTRQNGIYISMERQQIDVSYSNKCLRAECYTEYAQQFSNSW